MRALATLSLAVLLFQPLSFRTTPLPFPNPR
jgi:hypothetical protein